MTITIITPSFNQGKYLGQTIESVLSQAGDFYLEYIISDGGSTDNSVEIIKKYETLLNNRIYPIACKGIKFRWWSEKDTGQSDAINKGFKAASGDVLASLGSDDYYEPGALQKVYEIFIAYPGLDLLYGGGFYDNELIGKRIPVDVSPTSFEELRQGAGSLLQQATFFSKKIMEKIGYIDENLHFSMDYDLALKVFKNTNATFFSDFQFSNYRIWPNSKSGSKEDGFKKEDRLLRKRYGGPIINPRIFINGIRNMAFVEAIKKRAPKLFKLTKKIFYSIISVFSYKVR
ncbi:MAG: glycosyltransferase family 2 protein [Nanoarchaeota archaeon]